MHAAGTGTVTDSSKAVTFGILGGLLGLLLLIAMAAIILRAGVQLCIHHKRKNVKTPGKCIQQQVYNFTTACMTYN